MVYLNDIPGRITIIGGQAYLFFSGFSYLGMPSLPEFQKLLQESVGIYGSVFPSSRVSNTRHQLYQDFELMLSEYIDCQSSACFSSGYLAASAATQFLASKGNIFSLEHPHPALKHINLKKMASVDAIIEAVNSSNEPCSIVLESVNPLTGELLNFNWLLKIKRPVRVLVDDSHGIGILGENGEGAKALVPASDSLKYLICYSLSKAFSCEGGAVSGDEEDILMVKKMPQFTAAAPMSPVMVYAWMSGRNLFRNQLHKLRENLCYFKKQINAIDAFQFDGKLPICFLPDATLYERAMKYRILLSAFRYPTANDPLLTRSVINALHTKEDLNKLLYCITEGKSGKEKNI
ncbi:MAG TPA: aminotransferase class I/II-fold pyridoxal phosphate-dependent enzyme [Chitinophagaceae bacterium]|nr:aminotransferase class I/II-fold pyridoxal phosphate-dependent enzyme [Chitinophagaceae bacterium]